MKKKVFILLILVLISQAIFSQNNDEKKSLYETSLELFNQQNFEEALKLFLKYDSLYLGNIELNNKIGTCYLNSEFYKVKAIPYFENFINSDSEKKEASIFKELAHLYQLNYEFDKSKKMYRKYLKMEPRSKNEVSNYLKKVSDAKQLYEDSLMCLITNIGKAVNTEQSEILPFVTADESIMFYQNKETRAIFIAHNKGTHWQQPQEVRIKGLEKYDIVEFAGISHGGEELYLQLGDSKNTDIYYISDFLEKTNRPIALNQNINSKFRETNLSFSPDGNSMFFASNKPGGLGGFDIYKSFKNENNDWGPAVNVGPIINTEYDEQYPFIHPSLTKLYFSSNGHNTMGGYDIFKSDLSDNAWSLVQNLGFPINTTSDDFSYSLTAKGNSGYLSSARKDNRSNYDIYKVKVQENIPLILVKGTILAGSPPLPIKADISVLDRETKEKLKYIYNPNPVTGKYLLILPPGRNYNLIVKAEGYLPYNININFPNQSYFYENFQDIHLNAIKINSLGKTIGEEIKVKNTFYDIYKTNKESAETDADQKLKYDKLLNLVDALIEATDTMGLNAVSDLAIQIEEFESNEDRTEAKVNYNSLFSLIEKAIVETDSVSLKQLDHDSKPFISVQNKTFFDSYTEKARLDTLVNGNDTLFAVGVNKSLEDNSVLDLDVMQLARFEDIKLVTDLSVFFAKNKSEVKAEDIMRLEEISQLVVDHKNLYLKICAYANPQEDKNIAISRASEVRSLLVSKHVDLTKTKTVASFHSKNTGQKGRVVDVVVFESKQPLYRSESDPNGIRLVDMNQKHSHHSKDGIEYRVQIAAGPNLLNENDLFFKAQAVSVYQHDSKYKYTVGHFKTFMDAEADLLRLISLGFESAFIVKFKKGKRVD